MRNRSLSCIWIVALTVSCSSERVPPTPYTSYFGFEVQLPGDWTALNPRTVATANANETAESLQIAKLADASEVASIIDRVKAGDVEFYYDKTTLDEENKNNVSAQLAGESMGALSEDHAREMCAALPSQLSPMFSNNKVDLHLCELARSNEVDYFAVEYSVPAASYHVIQYEIPFREQQKLVLVGGTLESGRPLQRVREMQKIIADAATAFVARQARH